MPGRDLISKRTRTEFREFLVGYTLREIEAEFDAVGFKPDLSHNPQLGGQRRELVEQYYHRINFADPRQVGRLLQVYEAILINLGHQVEHPAKWYGNDVPALKGEYEKLLMWLRRDGYEFVDGRLKGQAKAGVALRHLSATTEELDADYLQAQIDRLHQAVEQDTELAIGQAKELVETCCKTIVSERGEPDAEKLELSPLVKKTMKVLKLVPDDVPNAAKGAKTVKAILGNLATISQGMAELRNLYGTGHGRHGRHPRLPARHARLAVGAATTLVTFLFETHQTRRSGQVEEAK